MFYTKSDFDMEEINVTNGKETSENPNLTFRSKNSLIMIL